ncbi:hypothetical protein CGRA01v4_14894 [Colletotrichum graminicola]|nr:hypothetical protein CGRA01v4_14894 [Colletotrichum graminicola]
MTGPSIASFYRGPNPHHPPPPMLAAHPTRIPAGEPDPGFMARGGVCISGPVLPFSSPVYLVYSFAFLSVSPHRSMLSPSASTT